MLHLVLGVTRLGRIPPPAPGEDQSGSVPSRLGDKPAGRQESEGTLRELHGFPALKTVPEDTYWSHSHSLPRDWLESAFWNVWRGVVTSLIPEPSALPQGRLAADDDTESGCLRSDCRHAKSRRSQQ